MASPPANIGLARVDLLAFTLAVTSYAELVGGQAEGASKEILESARRHCVRADVSELLSGLLESFLRTFESEPSQPQMLVSAIRLAEAKRGMAKFLNVGTRLPAILNWFQSHRDNFQDVLPGPASSSIQPLLKLGDIQDPMQRLKALGEFTYRSTLKVLRRWIMEEALFSLKLQPVGVAATKADIAATKPYVDQLQQVEMQLAAADSGSEDAAELSEQRVELQGDLDDIVEESSNPQAVETAVSTALIDDPLDELAKKYGLDRDQAAVVASTGKVVVSAGAGSGKTFTLIRVVQDSLNRGYRPDQIIGTTFTRKSKNEFNERLTGQGISGVRFGTTHSIAGEIILFCDPKLAPQLKDPMKRANSVFDMAIKQVSMRATGSVVPPDLAEKPIVPDPEPGVGSPQDLVAEHLVRVRAAIRKHPWSDFLKNLEDDLLRPKPFPLKGKALEFLVKMENKPSGGKWASDDDLRSAAEDATPDAAPDSGKTKYWNTPANMWWNLGISPRDSKKGLRTRIGRWQNGGESWQKIWKLHGSLPVPKGDDISALYEAAAVYAAYVWLKQNDPQYGPVLDMDDWLGKAVELLKRKPKALGTLQDRYKVMIVDEAQDLNGLQWELFGMLSKKTDRYLLVGDDFQCVHEDSMILLSDSTAIRAGDVVEGMQVQAWRNGALVSQTVRHAKPTQHTEGIKITTEGGRTLIMSPNHKLWASDPELCDEQHLVYLMYRRDRGFRVGTTNAGRLLRNGMSYNYGQRPHQERAEKLWVMDICSSKREARRMESLYSLRYQIPTLVFHTDWDRKFDPETIEMMFAEFGANGARLLGDRQYHFDYPNWSCQTFVNGPWRTIQLIAHGIKGTVVTLEWQESDGLDDKVGVDFKQNGVRHALRKWFTNYREALSFAVGLSERTGCNLAQRLSIPDELPMTKVVAAQLQPSMSVPVLEGGTIVKDRILSVERVSGGCFISLDVDDASNFVANDFLTSNSIYKFRGASADQFIKKPEEGFQLLQMGTNYRSGKNIVETANQLIAINPDQIKKTCRAARHNGDGSIEARIVPTHGDVARETAETIDSMIEAGSKPSDFGIAVRNNAEMDAFCLALMAKRIPFVCKRDPLEGTIPRITLSWFTLAVGLEAGREQVNTAITTAHQNPGFFLDKVFNENLRAAVPKGSDQLTTLLAGFEAYGGTQQRRNRNVHAYADAIRGIQNYAKSDDLLRAILEIRGQTGDTFLDRLIDEVDPEDVDPSLTGEEREKAVKDAASIPLEPLFGIAEAIPNPLDFMTFIGKMRRAQAALKKGQKDEETDEPAVRIETAHGWKGLECEHMFVVMADGVFPNAYAAEEEDGKGFEEERRLAYVAVTRGKKSVTVYSPLESYRGPRPTPPGQPPRPPRCSIFVDEMENGCMPVHGRELLMPGGGGGRLPPLSRDKDRDDEEAAMRGEEDNASDGRKFARQLVSSMDADPLDPHWEELV